MPEPTPPEVAASLHTVARLLREGQHLTPEAQQVLAELVDEIGNALEPGTVPSAELAHLAESTAHLAEVLHQRPEGGVLTAARDRLEQAALAVEYQAPVLTGLVRRLIDTLSNLGI
jgi:hypothetical protein